jgi:phosphatidyl-myo-inositol alpha-mannosyltransferase
VKIGIVSQSYYPRYGGVTEHVHSTMVELKRRGHDVTIITSRFRNGESTTTTGIERVGTNVMIPFNGAFVDFTVGLNLRNELKSVFRRHDFDILHTHCPISPSLPVIAIQSSPCPQLATFHTTAPRSWLQDLFQDYLRGVVDRLDARIAVSGTARATAEMYFPGEYHVIPNGVDIDRFHPTVAPFDEWRDPKHVNLLFVGRLDPRKGVPLLLQAMPEVVRQTNGRARLLIVGDSYLRAKYEASVPAALREHIHFLGHVPGRDLPRWYATGDVFVSPASGNESFGIVLVEAMAAGRAVIASDIPGYRSVVIPDVNGVVFPPGDVRALAQRMTELVNDAERRATLAARGRTHALDFAWPRVTDRIESLYREVLNRRGTVHSAA